VFENTRGEIVIRSDIRAREFVENYTRTYARKLKKEVDVRKVIEDQIVSRYRGWYHDQEER
jgi:hypothetical protein